MTEQPMPLEEAFLLLAQLAYTPWPPKEAPMDQMAADHSRDYRVKRLCDNARNALNELLADEDARRRIGHTLEGKAVVLAEKLEEQSAHVVAVWD